MWLHNSASADPRRIVRVVIATLQTFDWKCWTTQTYLDKNEKRWRNRLAADQSGETLADLKPRMVLGYCSLMMNKFQRANIRGEDNNADARGYTQKERGRS
jgi:hypothetical protein